MKKLFRRVLIATAVMVSALAAGTFTACARGSLEEQKREEGYTYTVTYDANGGTFGSNSTRTYALVKPNSPTPAPGYVDGKTQASVKVPTRTDYELVGEVADDNDDDKNEEALLSKSWFIAKTDENGNVVYEGEGENRAPVLLSEKPWDFVKDKVTGDVTLVAQWTQKLNFSLCIAEVDAETNQTTLKEIRSYTVKKGDTIVDKLYNKVNGEIVRRADNIKVKQTGYTLLDFYLDENYQTLLDTDYAHPGLRVIGTETDPETGVTTEVKSSTVVIYAKFLKGRFDFITANTKKTLTGTSNWYVLEDVDYAGEAAWDAVGEFKGTIYGNGYTLKNVKVQSQAKRTTDYNAHSIFGKVSGLVENITFENATMEVYTQFGAQVLGDQRTTFLAYEFTEKGSMKGVTLQDCKLVLKTMKNGEPTLFSAMTGECGGLWWTAPTAEQADVTVKENDTVVETIKIVQE